MVQIRMPRNGRFTPVSVTVGERWIIGHGDGGNIGAVRTLVSLVSVGLCLLLCIALPVHAGDDAASVGVDTVSMASPDREPIWTARLFFIAINDRDTASLYGLFAADAYIRVTSQVSVGSNPILASESVAPVERRGWIERSIVQPGVNMRNRGTDVSGRTITAQAEWVVEGVTAEVTIVFEQSSDGLIHAMTIAPR